MSGDVQPRKRKDKRRKKEGGSLGAIHEPVLSHKFHRSDSEDKKIFEVPDQGEKIHIQNEHGVGGNICVKIIFFCLFIILIGAVSLIYIQSQGSTDVDLPSVEESRFAEYFAGWLDESTDEHEAHEHNVEDHDEHEDDHDEHDEHDEHEEHEEREVDEEEHESEEEGTEQFLDPLQKFFGVQQSDDNEEGDDDKNEEENYSNVHQVEESEESDNQQDGLGREEVEKPSVKEVREEREQPVPPPRANRNARGGQDVEEEDEDGERVEENEIESESQNDVKVEEVQKVSRPEEEKSSQVKVESEDEWTFKQEFDFAEEQFENNPKAAIRAYDKILAKKPDSIKVLIMRARAYDHLAEMEKSNAYLKQATNAYKTLLLNQENRLDDDMYLNLADRCINRMRFGGDLKSAIDIHKALIRKFPNTPKHRNTLAVTYLMMNRIPVAKTLLNETLSLWPKDGFALVHYGFVLKTSDNNMEEGAKLMMAGIQTKEEGVIDGMFFFHLGDALNRLGRGKEAMDWYDLGVKEGLFLSRYQRSLYNVDRLKGQPWWTKEETTYQDFFKRLEENWREIRKEGLSLLNSKGVNLFKEESENLKDTGDWRQLDLYFRGRKQPSCNKAPVTCSLVSSFKPASTCTRGQIKFSVMLPNTHVWPHCGPTNCRLRSHLGLVVPKETYIRVAEETRSWEEGKFIIFDDSFEHEVWHNGTGARLVLIVDVWHPELTNHERQYLSPI